VVTAAAAAGVVAAGVEAAAVVAVVAAAAAAAASGAGAGAAVGLGVDDNAGAGTLRGQIHGQRLRARIHSSLVLGARQILHARYAHCKNHDEAANRMTPVLLRDFAPIHALAEDVHRVATSRRDPAHLGVQTHIQSS